MKKLMMTVVLAAFSVVGFVGCADACAKQAECAKKSGATFSQTECQNQAKIDQEKATNAGCGGEYNAFISCAAALDCTTLSNGGILTECGAKYEDYVKCAL